MCRGKRSGQIVRWSKLIDYSPYPSHSFRISVQKVYKKLFVFAFVYGESLFPLRRTKMNSKVDLKLKFLNFPFNPRKCISRTAFYTRNN